MKSGDNYWKPICISELMSMKCLNIIIFTPTQTNTFICILRWYKLKLTHKCLGESLVEEEDIITYFNTCFKTNEKKISESNILRDTFNFRLHFCKGLFKYFVKYLVHTVQSV